MLSTELIKSILNQVLCKPDATFVIVGMNKHSIDGMRWQILGALSPRSEAIADLTSDKIRLKNGGTIHFASSNLGNLRAMQIDNFYLEPNWPNSHCELLALMYLQASLKRCGLTASLLRYNNRGVKEDA
jgi:hypothetical protein